MKRICMILLFLPVLAWAGKTGFIAGNITENSTGDPIPGCNIILEGTKLGAASGMNGDYLIQNVPPGKYTLIASALGYEQVQRMNVNVKKNDTTRVNFQMVAGALPDEVVALHTEKTDSENDVFSMAPQTVQMQAGVLSKAQGAPGQAPHRMLGFTAAEAGTDWNTEEYDRINESGFLEVLKNPMSTFAADVDAASYANARRFIMMDRLPMKDVVRSEEFINYFDYDYPQPKQDHPLSINIEYGKCPWNQAHHLVHIGLRGKSLNREEAKPSNLVFLIDVSGSMDHPKKLPLLQKAFNLLADQLQEKDRVAIVVYASATGLVLPSTPGSEKQTIKDAINRLEAGGSTAGGAGIKLAYEVAKENRIKGGNNRVILATDGDFNVGISSTAELTRFIEEKRDEGIFLTVLGFGMGNYKDHRLQELADRGNGNHAYIDNIMEAKKVLVHEITATLFTIAKDVKIQVEFNPAKIASYRLIGYENRKLADKDFEDDTKDAGEIGAGHTVTALYEVIPADPDKDTETMDLKYQTTQIKKDAEKSDEVLTVRIRYKPPDGDTSLEFSKVLKRGPEDPGQLSDNFRFSAAVAEFAMILRDSEFRADSELDQVRALAKSAMGRDPYGYRAEFLQLVGRVEMLNK
ncbi:von Willebrand factor type A domain-containing protein [bacterium]|nr:von Willebrand factor type A domain-containing protein [bacterium]